MMNRQFDYHAQAVNERLVILQEVLAWEATHREFTPEQRILINQERGSLMDYMNYLSGIIKHAEVRWYLVPEELNARIQRIADRLEITGWSEIQLSIN